MNRWWGSKDDSDRQAGERASRAARRVIADQVQVKSDSEDDFQDCDTSGFFLNVDGNDDELDAPPIVPEEPADNMPATPFDQEDKENDAEAWKKEIKVPFDQDINYWFNKIEAQMKKFGINRQWDKKDAAAALLPEHVIEECKPILRLTEAEAGPHIYKDLKAEVVSIFGPRDEDVFKKAIALRLTGTPSALGKKLIHLICPGSKPFDGCHCAKIVYGFWDSQLTVPIRTALAGQPFNKDTYQALFKLADQVFIANGGKAVQPAVVAAVTSSNAQSTPTPSDDNPQVAAVGRGAPRGRGGRGRGGRGRGNSNSYNQNNQNQGQNSSNQTSTNNKPHQKGPKHPDLPSSAGWACAQHWKKGRGAPYCSDPLICKWVSIVAPRPPPNASSN